MRWKAQSCLQQPGKSGQECRTNWGSQPAGKTHVATRDRSAAKQTTADARVLTGQVRAGAISLHSAAELEGAAVRKALPES